MLSINLSDSDINNLLETVIDDRDGDLVKTDSYRQKIEHIVIEALNEHIDKLFVEPNKHLGKHHIKALGAISADQQHFNNSL